MSVGFSLGSHMILALTGLLTFVLSLLVGWWQALEVRRCRWHFYALRDRLRWRAVEEARFRESPSFLELDHVLTELCHDVNLPSLSTYLKAAGYRFQEAAPAMQNHDKHLHQLLVDTALNIIDLLQARHLMLALAIRAVVKWRGVSAAWNAVPALSARLHKAWT